jgi:hypothetical protein
MSGPFSFTRTILGSGLSIAIASVVALTATALGSATSNAATVTYNYTGGDFLSGSSPYNTADKVTATVTFASALPTSQPFIDETGNITLFSFNVDPVQTLSNLNADVTIFTIATDATGAIISWHFYVQAPVIGTDDVIQSIFGGGDMATMNPSPGVFGVGEGPNGSWAIASIASPVPETSTWVMLILGFACMGFMAYGRKSKPALSAA